MEVKSVAGIIFSEKRESVLLILRRDVPVWVLPGGGVEEGERPEAAVLREIEEETGLKTEVIRLVGIYTPINRLAKLTHVYECRKVGGKLRRSAETRNVRFFPLSELPKEIPPPYQTWIEEALQKKSSVIERPLTELTYWVFLKYLVFHPCLTLRFLFARAGLPFNSPEDQT